MRGGDVQRISAGTGIMHSEINESDREPVHLLQIWIMPDRKNAMPSYAEKSFAKVEPGQLRLITSKTGREGSIAINQDADLYLAKLRQGESLKHTFTAGRNGWLQVIEGELDANGHRLADGDAAAIAKTDALMISAATPAHFLLFDLN
jgi:redox-sensitive bicupin YhaK (pirin superfamily)